MSVGGDKQTTYFGQAASTPVEQVATYSMFNGKGTRSARDITKTFKQIPNAYMRGSTFDVRHLDNFIQSGAGNLPVNPSGAQKLSLTGSIRGGSGLKTTMEPLSSGLNVRDTMTLDQDTAGGQQLNSALSSIKNRSPSKSALGNTAPVIYTNVRPSTAFIRLARDQQVQNDYVD